MIATTTKMTTGYWMPQPRTDRRFWPRKVKTSASWTLELFVAPAVISSPAADRLVDSEEDETRCERREERVDAQLGDQEPVDEAERGAREQRGGEREPDVPVHGNPERVSLAYTEDSVCVTGPVHQRPRGDRRVPHRQVGARAGLRATQGLWSFDGDRIAVRFQYESHDARRRLVPQLRQRAVGVRRPRADEAPRGQHQRRPIDESERRIFGPRPEHEHGAIDIPLR